MHRKVGGRSEYINGEYGSEMEVLEILNVEIQASNKFMVDLRDRGVGMDRPLSHFSKEIRTCK